MIKIENLEVTGWEAALRGMRNPMNSWDRSDSYFDTKFFTTEPKDDYILNHTEDMWYIGKEDRKLMHKLAKAGNEHAKFRRMINVTMDITAPLYWWKEFDTYKVGTVANSCSTMHKIHEKEFELSDFSCEHLIVEDFVDHDNIPITASIQVMNILIDRLNIFRMLYLETKDKNYWWQMIQLLPSSYNQRRTVQLNYEVLNHIYHQRKDHKLDEWREFCDYILDSLPYSEELIEVSNE